MRVINCFVIICLLFVVNACSDGGDSIPKTGDYFVRANPWLFYFVDGEGNDLLSLKQGSVLPMVYEEKGGKPQIVPENVDEDKSYSYKGNQHTVGYDSRVGKHFWTTSISGNQGYVDKKLYVVFNETEIDSIQVKFKFYREGCVGGDGICVDIVRLDYNNTTVIKNDDYVSGKGIWITREAGKVSVTTK